MSDKLDFAELKASGLLPSPKGVALTIMKLCQTENVSLPDLAHTIQADPVLAGRIIKLANVANPNKSRPIASVTTDTLILIGIHAVRQVVLGFSLITSYKEGTCKAFDYHYYWSRSVAMASAAQAIGAALRIAPPAELFTCGLLSGIGRLGIAVARPEAYSELLARLAGAPRDDLAAAETERFGISHRDLSAEMMIDWGIPKLFVDAVFFHENPEHCGFAEGSRQRKLTHTLHLAALLADAYLAKESSRIPLLPRIFQIGNALGLSSEQVVNIANQTMAEWHEWGYLLNIRTETIPPFQLPEAAGQPNGEADADADNDRDREDELPAMLPMRILFADDDETLLCTAEKTLVAAGHTVLKAKNGRQAFELAEREKPQVIVANWLIPEKNGISLCRAIRETSWGADTYFMILTTLEDERRQIEAFEAGADAYLKKPFNPRLLNAKLMVAQRRLAGLIK